MSEFRLEVSKFPSPLQFGFTLAYFLELNIKLQVFMHVTSEFTITFECCHPLCNS